MSVRLLVFTNLCRHMSNMRLVLVLMAVELTITDQEEKALSDPSRETSVSFNAFQATYCVQETLLACQRCG
jgi:hypothetical protein